MLMTALVGAVAFVCLIGVRATTGVEQTFVVVLTIVLAYRLGQIDGRGDY